ncbi:MAG: ATP synthase F1 subunit epsilon [Lachnospiraceae bacterium]|nr:ATP synthase F1 subunit epsilon [Lachnospiraceae bacterium]
MATFRLQVVSMDGLEFDGEVQRLKLRSIDGDLAILARHINYCTAVGMGKATVVLEDGTERNAACIGGMLSMMDNLCRLIPTTWEWGDEIDVERAQRAKERAEQRLHDEKLEEQARVRAEAKLYRALVRLSAAGK